LGDEIGQKRRRKNRNLVDEEDDEEVSDLKDNAKRQKTE